MVHIIKDKTLANKVSDYNKNSLKVGLSELVVNKLKEIANLEAYVKFVSAIDTNVDMNSYAQLIVGAMDVIETEKRRFDEYTIGALDYILETKARNDDSKVYDPNWRKSLLQNN